MRVRVTGKTAIGNWAKVRRIYASKPMAEREIDRGERLIFERTREKCSNALIGGWKNRSYSGRQPGTAD